MSDDFYKTLMGRRFYEATMPGLVAQLERLNGTLEKMGEAEVLDAIADLLDSKLPTNDGWEQIAELLRATGRRVRAP